MYKIKIRKFSEKSKFQKLFVKKTINKRNKFPEKAFNPLPDHTVISNNHVNLDLINTDINNAKRNLIVTKDVIILEKKNLNDVYLVYQSNFYLKNLKEELINKFIEYNCLASNRCNLASNSRLKKEDQEKDYFSII